MSLMTIALIFESSYEEHQRLVNALDWSWIILGSIAALGWFMYYRMCRTFARHMEKEHGVPTSWYTPGHHARHDANRILHFLYERRKYLMKGCGYERKNALIKLPLFKDDYEWYGPFLEFFVYVVHTLGCEIVIRERSTESIETCSKGDVKIITGRNLDSIYRTHVPPYYSPILLFLLSSVSLMALAAFLF